MVVHGADWFIPEQAQFYGDLDVCYIRTVMPFYFKKCAVVISVSQLTTDNFYTVLKLPPGKLKTVYFGPARHFKRETNQDKLQEVRNRYNLPERFIFTLTKRAGDTRKNLGQLFKGYARYHQTAMQPYPLVVGGKDCHLFRAEYGLNNDKYGNDIYFPDWIDQADLPAVYSLAELYLYPSNLEAFPIPITEAMACGTPIITSRVNGLEEIAGDAALLVNPGDEAEIAAAIAKLVSDEALRQTLSAQGLARAKMFTWEACARKTIDILEGLGA
jgi:glycosyltransferase involved in cell wall biosynthesis